MSIIIISDLQPAGSELFSDSESYLSELTDGELATTYGGDVHSGPNRQVTDAAYIGGSALLGTPGTPVSIVATGIVSAWSAIFLN